MALFGEFITARLQREIPMEVAVGVSPTAHMRVGQLVKLENGVLKTVTKKDDATHIIAQSDMTMERGHVPVEYRDYRYSDYVAGTVSDTSNFLGVYKKADFPAAATGDNGKYAYASDEGKVYKSSGTAWAADTTITVTTKKVALFKIINKDDIIVKSIG